MHEEPGLLQHTYDLVERLEEKVEAIERGIFALNEASARVECVLATIQMHLLMTEGSRHE